jgi:H+/gluconate symporter-like permease
MLVFALFLIFIVFAALMFSRKMPALLALPSMAILIAALAGLPLESILNSIIGQGAVKLAPVFVAVFAGAMMGRVMTETGIAAAIVKRAAEFGGEKPLVVAAALMLVTAILFTTLQGLGAIITVGSLVLPIMMSLGIPRQLAAVLFLFAFGTGFIFNPILFTLYRSFLQLKDVEVLPPSVPQFGGVLALLMGIMMVIYTFWAAKKSGDLTFSSPDNTQTPPSVKNVFLGLWKGILGFFKAVWLMFSYGFLSFKSKKINNLSTQNSPLTEPTHNSQLITHNSNISFLAMLTPIVPIILFFSFNYWGLKLDFIAAFLIGSVFAVFTTNYRNSIKTLTAAAIKGIEDGAPAAFLMMGIGMLLSALNQPAIKTALEPLIKSLPFSSPLFYVAFFGLLSPLALYRGPLNIFGIGIGLFSIMFGTGILPPLVLLAAIMCVMQVQNICDPTNTHNVWVANFVGLPVEELTKKTLLPILAVCLVGLMVAVFMFF